MSESSSSKTMDTAQEYRMASSSLFMDRPTTWTDAEEKIHEEKESTLVSNNDDMEPHISALGRGR